MTGKRILTAILLALAITAVSACGKGPGSQQSPDGIDPSSVNAGDGLQTQAPADTGQVGPTESEPVVIDQKNEELPDAKFLSTYPGILKCMSLTLEQILKVFGSNSQLYENFAQGYDIYQFPDYNLTIEYDAINERLSSIRTGDAMYYLYSGTIKEFDIDNDGKPENVAAYEDESLNGKVTVFSSDGLIKADQTMGYFDGQCDMTLLSGYGTDKESLVILEAKAGNTCEIFSYSGGNLISMVPPDQDNVTNDAEVSWDGRAVALNLPDLGTSYECPVPDRLYDSYPGPDTAVQFQFAENAQPLVTSQGLSLLVRHSLQVRYYEDELAGGTDTSLDIAQVTEEYQYLGGGKWQKISTKGGPKYSVDSMPSGLISNDFKVGNIKLLAPAAENAQEIGLDLSKYSETDISSGVLYKYNGMNIGITNDTVSYISLEKGSDAETARGLKTGDAKQAALDLYGLPDKGYFEDSIWTYYYLREEDTEDGSFLSADNLNIEFDGDRVSRIWVSMYMPLY